MHINMNTFKASNATKAYIYNQIGFIGSKGIVPAKSFKKMTKTKKGWK